VGGDEVVCLVERLGQQVVVSLRRLRCELVDGDECSGSAGLEALVAGLVAASSSGEFVVGSCFASASFDVGLPAHLGLPGDRFATTRGDRLAAVVADCWAFV
jgi:hypothetical protein